MVLSLIEWMAIGGLGAGAVYVLRYQPPERRGTERPAGKAQPPEALVNDRGV